MAKLRVNISGNEQPIYNGNLENDDSENSFPNIKTFIEHSYGLITANLTTVAVSCKRQLEYVTYFCLNLMHMAP